MTARWERGRVSRFLQAALAIAAVGLFVAGWISGRFTPMLGADLCLLACNVIYAASRWRQRLLFFVFQMTLFIFLMARPTISMLRGDVWWGFEPAAVIFALTALFLTQICLRAGAMLVEWVLENRLPAPAPKRPLSPAKATYQANWLTAMRVVTLAFFALTVGVHLLLELEKLAFMQGREYTELYVSFQSRWPSFLATLASMHTYALCLFLATLPSKRLAFVPLAVFVVSALPSLIIGLRNPIVLHFLFALIYFLLRDALEGGHRWVGAVEKTALIVMTPAAMVFMAAYNYIRDGKAFTLSVWDSLVDLLYKQGVSFDVLCIGHEALPLLPDAVPKNYTFGPFVDYIMHGTAAQRLFGALDLGSQNSVIHAVYGSSFAHSMSYVAREDYLQGHGWGSSYLLESYADWGYIGVAVVSLLLGALLIALVRAMRGGVMMRTVTLVCLAELYFAPRAEATGWLVFLITAQFWLAMIFCWFTAGLFARSYSCEGNRPLRTRKGVSVHV